MADNYTVQIDLEIIDAEETAMILEKFTGIDGKDGKDGTDGKSAYQYAVEHGYTGTETEFAEYMANAAEYSEHIQETVDDAIQDALDSGDFVPDFSIGTVQTVPHGQSASATISGTERNPVLNLNIPQGASGNETIDDTAGFGDDDLVWSADKTLKEVDSKADAILKTIDTPASIVTIEDGADDLPVREMRIAIEPVQDLNGFDAPWPAGGWKNLYNKDGTDVNNGYEDGKILKSTGSAEAPGSPQYWCISEYISVEPSQSYTISGMRNLSASGTIYCCQYDESKNFVQSVDQSFKSITFTTGSNVKFVRLTAEKSQMATIQIENGSTATDYAPYSNICPISGWTGANVTRIGKNLVIENTIALGYVINETTGNPQGNGGHKITDFIKVVPGNTYTVSGTDLHKRQEGQTSAAAIRIGQYDENYVCVGVSASDMTSATKTITVSNRTAYVRVQVGYGASNIQFEEGSVASAFEPYGTTCSIAFPETVYGGNLTIHADGTGELVVDRVFINQDGTRGSVWEIFERYVKFRFGSNLKNKSAGAKIISNYYVAPGEAFNSMSIVNNGDIRLYNLQTISGASDLDGIKAYLAEHPLEICCELITATSYQLSAPQVRTLLGLNKILANTGNVELLTYPVDTGTALNNQVTTTQGMIAGTDTPVATESHVVGDVFICNNKLYKATDAIAVGESVIEGSNVVQTSVAELILNRPDFVFNAAVMKNHPVSITLGNQSRAIVFATGANAERVALISLLGGSTQAYAWDIHASAQLTATIDGSTVTLAYSGSGSCFIDILKLSGNVTATMA